jgi:hypothetical protein
LTGLLAPQVGASEVRFPSEPGIGERLGTRDSQCCTGIWEGSTLDL